MKWEPIEKYDKLSKYDKVWGDFVFLFEEDRSGRQYHPRLMHTGRIYGHRVCIAFCRLPKRDSFIPDSGEPTT